MSRENEHLEILKMVEAKRITAEEAARLLGALAEERLPVRPPRPEPAVWPGGNQRWFRLQVQEPGRQSVNVTLPLVALPAILHLARRWVPDEHQSVLEAVIQAVNTDFQGELVRVEEPGGPSVRVWIE